MKRIGRVLAGICAVLLTAAPAFAEMTLPTVTTTNIEAAGTAVGGVVAVYALIKCAIRLYKGM